LGAAEYALNKQTVRELAYQFEQKFGVTRKFPHQRKMAGYAWLASILERNLEVSIRQAEGLSLATAQGMNREETDNFFIMQDTVLNKPRSILNVDESGIQLINKTGNLWRRKRPKMFTSLSLTKENRMSR
jgi:hypothetical protein